MKPITTTSILIFICFCVYGQQADKILRPRASPFVASSPNNLVGVDTNNNFTIWAFDKDSLKIMPWNLRWVNDSIIAVGDRRFALTSASYNNPSWISQLSASKVFGLSPVALTGDYNDLSNKPNMALYYLASNPAGYISNVTSGMISAALGYAPLASETDPSVPSNVKAITGTNISNWNTAFGWGNHASQGYLKGVDTVSLSNRINARLSVSDTVSLSNRINTKQSQLSGTGFIKVSGTTISYDNSTYYLSSNPNGYISSVPAQSFTSLTGKPVTLSGYGITDAYPLSGNPSGFLTTEVDGSITNEIQTLSRVGDSLSLSSQTPKVYAPIYTGSNPTFNNAPTVTLNTSKQISTTKNARVSYTVLSSVQLALVVSSGSVQTFLEISPNNSTWTTINSTGLVETLAVAVATTRSQYQNIQGEVPAGYWVRLRTVITQGILQAGTSITFSSGQEVQYN